ncbi:unnamed protein product [Cuscuta europaea]|uniref:Uncharacterized protein n=1 Tax=Cuscuta europaea TaxID=41803 RepID=A0A9P1EI87_CUSEU|nr:unnamed protein product [Cuscuta europaea]
MWWLMLANYGRGKGGCCGWGRGDSGGRGRGGSGLSYFWGGVTGKSGIIVAIVTMGGAGHSAEQGAHYGRSKSLSVSHRGRSKSLSGDHYDRSKSLSGDHYGRSKLQGGGAARLLASDCGGTGGNIGGCCGRLEKLFLVC